MPKGQPSGRFCVIWGKLYPVFLKGLEAKFSPKNDEMRKTCVLRRWHPAAQALSSAPLTCWITHIPQSYKEANPYQRRQLGFSQITLINISPPYVARMPT